MEDTFETKLLEWAERVVKNCHEVAKKIDKPFYAFQSKPVENPEVLILGINPANKDNSDYKAQYNNKSDVWGEDVKKNQGMTVKAFLKENPQWKEHEKWRFWKNLKKVFHTAKMENILSSNNYVYMNALYFSTKNMGEFYTLKNANEIFKECLQYTEEMINILKPEMILCLSIPECFNRLLNKTGTKFIHPQILKGEFYGIPTYGIPHTSGARGVSNNDWTQIGLMLHKEFYGEDLLNLDSYINKIALIFSELAEDNNLEVEFNNSAIINQFGTFRFKFREHDWLRMSFEFRSPFYRDLHYGFHISDKTKIPEDKEKQLHILGLKNDGEFSRKWGKNNEACYMKHGWVSYMKCDKYSDWVSEKEEFNKNEFIGYFNQLISSMKEQLNQLK